MSPSEVDGCYLRSHKAKCLQQSYSSILRLEEGDLHAETYCGGVIIPVRKAERGSIDYGGVMTANGQYVKSSIVPGWASGWYDDYEVHIDERTAVYCGPMIGHWGHFLLESTTRLWYYLERDQPDYVYVFLVREGSSPPLEGNFRAFFALLGIADRIVFLNEATQYRRVIVPERSFQYKRFYAPQYTAVFDKVIENALKMRNTENLPERIYLSRGCFDRALRSEVGLDMVDAFFSSNGYRIIYPEKIPLHELICYLQNAEECASESGTAAHNFLFCRNRQRTLVMERQTVVNDAQTSIDRVRCLHATYVDCHLTIKPIYTGAGPFFLCYTKWMESFAEDRGYASPDPSFLSTCYLQKCYDEFVTAFQRIHSAARPVSGSIARHEDSLQEAILETESFLTAYGIGMRV